MKVPYEVTIQEFARMLRRDGYTVRMDVGILGISPKIKKQPLLDAISKLTLQERRHNRVKFLLGIDTIYITQEDSNQWDFLPSIGPTQAQQPDSRP